MSDLMKGKRGLIMGVANKKSLAWGIAKEAVRAQQSGNAGTGPERNGKNPIDQNRLDRENMYMSPGKLRSGMRLSPRISP